MADCDHPPRTVELPAPERIEAATRLFRALGDPGRLRVLMLLAEGEWCVGELAEALDDGLSTVSQRLRHLLADGLVARRRDGRHIHYRLADDHVLQLLQAGLEHADELTAPAEATA